MIKRGKTLLLRKIKEIHTAQLASIQSKRQAKEVLTLSQLNKLLQDLRDNTYQSQPYTVFYKLKKDGQGKRQICQPCKQDKLVQKALLRVIESELNNIFSSHSYCRRFCSQVKAVSYIHTQIQGKPGVLLKMDFKDCFEHIQHKRLFQLLNKYLQSPALTRLIRTCLLAGFAEEGKEVIIPTVGIPQGSPLSALLCNLYLNGLDKVFRRKGFIFVRYLDDIIIYFPKRKLAERFLTRISQKLEEHLYLSLNTAQNKTNVYKYSKIEMLGHTFTDDRASQLQISPGNINQFKQITQTHIQRWMKHKNTQQFIQDITYYFQGWANAFRLVENEGQLRELDAFVAKQILWAVRQNGTDSLSQYRVLKDVFGRDKARYARLLIQKRALKNLDTDVLYSLCKHSEVNLSSVFRECLKGNITSPISRN